MKNSLVYTYVGGAKQVKRQFVTTHQLQQQQRNKKPIKVLSPPRKSARLNNAQAKNPTEVKSARKPKIPPKGRDENTEVLTPRKSARLNITQVKKSEINEVALKENSSQKSASNDNPQEGSDEDVNLKSTSVRRKLNLHNPRDEDEIHETMDENEIPVRNCKLTHTFNWFNCYTYSANTY